MPSLANHQSAATTKLMMIGDSGTGKTGALTSLALAGYRLRVLDFDNGLDICIGILRGLVAGGKITQAQCDDALARIHYITCTDQMKSLAGKVFPVAAKAWTKAMTAMEKWKDEETDLGPVASWGPDDVLVVDSLSFAGKAATRHIQSLNSRLAVLPVWQDYLQAQALLESFCAMLYSTDIRCNVIVLSHIREVGKSQMIQQGDKVVKVEEEGSRKGYPETGTGTALSPNIGRYFNAILQTDRIGTGSASRYIIRTIPHDNIGLKNPAPSILKAQYDLATGLAEYFLAIRGAHPSVAA